MTTQLKLELNKQWQWQQYFNNMGPVGRKPAVIRYNHPGYLAYGPLPVDPISTRHYNPRGEVYYSKPSFYNPLGRLQTVPQFAAHQPLTCCNSYGVCESTQNNYC